MQISTWDKVFDRSESVHHEKVTFRNNFGIDIVADIYKPLDTQGKLPALAVSSPFGAVKEQSSGLYAQTMAERGFLDLAFDPSFTGESGGEPRWTASLDINTEDFLAAIDYLGGREDVDANNLGIIGVCGWGGIVLNAAALDPRIKATLSSTMYDRPVLPGMATLTSRIALRTATSNASSLPNSVQPITPLRLLRGTAGPGGCSHRSTPVFERLPQLL